MKKKLTTFMFGLLLAVGWAPSAQAQLKAMPMKVYAPATGTTVTESENDTPIVPGNSGMSRAPRRATITADVTHTFDWYYNKQYTWSGGTAHLTDAVTDPNQMIALLSYVYTEKTIPGTLYSEPKQRDNEYPSIGYGWDITGNRYSDITVTTNNSQAYISSIVIANANGTTLTSWTYDNNGTSLPNGWSSTKSFTRSSFSGYYYDCIYMNGGGTITIPASAFANTTGYVKITVTSGTSDTSYGSTVSFGGATATLTTSLSGWYVNVYPGIDELPIENGYTAFIVKLFDGETLNNDPAQRAPLTTANRAELVDYFSTYVKEIQLLTDGMRVGEGTSNAGTVFSYTGMLNRFFFISKGKLAYVTSSDRAPFYSMYEEFSPTTQSNTTGIDDFYAEMVGGNSYGIIHDCQSVNYMQHYFSMTGSTGTEEKSVAAMVFYIPDDRGSNPADSTGSKWRNYDHQPQVGLYTIHLAAETAPVASYSESNRQYDVFLDWTSSLNQMVSNTVPQTYVIYKVTFDDQGNRVYTYLDEVEDVTTYTYQEDQLQTSQTFTYVILGYPTNATNKPTVNAHGDIEGGQFYTYSNIDDVQIPGWFDFMVLYRERYESDFKVDEEKNYYRNYLYPTNLAPGTGMTMGQLKQEWPNQTASYTLWRDNTGIAKLEVRAIGNKVYYRIRYYEGSQVTNWRNDIEMPYPYVEIPNENN